jgi:hypothetical protein
MRGISDEVHPAIDVARMGASRDRTEVGPSRSLESATASPVLHLLHRVLDS